MKKEERRKHLKKRGCLFSLALSIFSCIIPAVKNGVEQQTKKENESELLTEASAVNQRSSDSGTGFMICRVPMRQHQRQRFFSCTAASLKARDGGGRKRNMTVS